MSDIKRLATAEKPRPEIVVKFGFSEGLNFGCGFFVAGFVFSLVVVPLTALIISTLGMGLI